MQSERDIAARITRMKALERSRQIPREFALYLPSSILPAVQQDPTIQSGSHRIDSSDRRITWTTSLPLILGHLDLATRKPVKPRRPRPRHKGIALEDSVAESSPDIAPYIPRIYRVGPSIKKSKSASPAGIRRAKKGKHRDGPVSNLKPKPIPEGPQAKREAWFLDVANPTWADLRAIGKVSCAIQLSTRG